MCLICIHIVDSDRRKQLTSKLSELEQIQQSLDDKVKKLEKIENDLVQKLNDLRYARVSTRYQWMIRSSDVMTCLQNDKKATKRDIQMARMRWEQMRAKIGKINHNIIYSHYSFML